MIRCTRDAPVHIPTARARVELRVCRALAVTLTQLIKAYIIVASSEKLGRWRVCCALVRIDGHKADAAGEAGSALIAVERAGRWR